MTYVTKAVAASVIDLFCGAGGLSYGFKREAFKIAAGIDIDEACRFPYEKNNKSPFIRKDVAKLMADDLGALFEPNITRSLVGCAPCQPFSTYSQKNENPDWKLLETFGALIDAARPDIVSMETSWLSQRQNLRRIRCDSPRRRLPCSLEGALWPRFQFSKKSIPFGAFSVTDECDRNSEAHSQSRCAPNRQG